MQGWCSVGAVLAALPAVLLTPDLVSALLAAEEVIDLEPCLISLYTNVLFRPGLWQYAPVGAPKLLLSHMASTMDTPYCNWCRRSCLSQLSPLPPYHRHHHTCTRF